MAKFDENNGFHVYGWMRIHLGLSGNELLTYAIVRQFSQGDAGIYTGGIPYIADFIGCSRETARKYLHNLVAKKYIIPIDASQNGVPFVNYVADNEIPKKFGYIPKNLGRDTQKKEGGIPKNFGTEIEYKENKKENNNPPTPQEVAEYAKTQGFADPTGFAAYYCAYQTENGWMTGKGKARKPIDNWKLNVIAWGRYRKNDIFSSKTTASASMNRDAFKTLFANQ